jgi:hypothetical protein
MILQSVGRDDTKDISFLSSLRLFCRSVKISLLDSERSIIALNILGLWLVRRLIHISGLIRIRLQRLVNRLLYRLLINRLLYRLTHLGINRRNLRLLYRLN